MNYREHFVKHWGVYMNVFLLVVVAILIGNHYLKLERKNSSFRKECRLLEGRQLTVNNVQVLQGRVYGNDFQPINQEDIDQYLAFLNRDTVPEKKSPSVAIYHDAISISNDGLDDTWRCIIKSDKKGKIISTYSYFQPD